MMVWFNLFAMLLIFWGGTLFAVNTAMSLVFIGAGFMAAGTVFAAVQARGFEGQRIVNVPVPFTWEKLFLNVVRMALDRKVNYGKEHVYVQTSHGPVPLTGVFTARINHVLAIVMDTEEASAVDATHEFNSLKQGVM